MTANSANRHGTDTPAAFQLLSVTCSFQQRSAREPGRVEPNLTLPTVRWRAEMAQTSDTMNTACCHNFHYMCPGTRSGHEIEPVITSFLHSVMGPCCLSFNLASHF